MRRRPPESNRTAPLVPDTTPFRSPTPSEEPRRRAFEGLRKRTPSPAMDARARAALDKSKEAMAQEREAMSRRLGQVLGLDAPDMDAIAGDTAPPTTEHWGPVLVVYSSMPVTTRRTYAGPL